MTDNITWRDYVDTRLSALERAGELERKNLEHRLDSMNAIRDQLRDQADSFVTNVEHDAVCDRLERIDRDIRELRESRAELAGKASQTSVLISYILAIVSLIMAIVMKFL